MISHRVVFPWPVRIIKNIQFWLFWRGMAKGGDALGKEIIRKFGFIGFICLK